MQRMGPKVNEAVLSQFEYMKSSICSIDQDALLYVICNRDQVVTVFLEDCFFAFESREDGIDFIWNHLEDDPQYVLSATKMRYLQQLLDRMPFSEIGMYYMRAKKTQVKQRFCSFFKLKCGL